MHNSHEIRELGKVLQVAYFETLDASPAIIESVKKFDDPERNRRFEEFAQKVLDYQDQLRIANIARVYSKSVNSDNWPDPDARSQH